jgi:hypothetical protein
MRLHRADAEPDLFPQDPFSDFADALMYAEADWYQLSCFTPFTPFEALGLFDCEVFALATPVREMRM